MAELTRRERQVLIKVAAGKTNPEIAKELGLAGSTVKSCLMRIMRKLEVRNRTEAAMKAVLDFIPSEEVLEKIIWGKQAW